MRLCMITGDWPPCVSGVADGMRNFADFFTRDEENKMDILTTKGFKEDNFHRPNLKIYDAVKKWSFSDLFPMVRLLKKIEPDVVHIQYPAKEYGKRVFINILPLFLRLLGFKVVITVHEYTFNMTLKGRMRLWPSILASNRILTADPVYIPDIRKVFFWKKIEPIPIASNIPATGLTARQKTACRKKLTGEKDVLLLGFFGFINRNKIIRPLFAVLKELIENHRLKARLVFIGDIGTDREYIRLLHEDIKSLGLEKECFFTGHLNEKEVADTLSVLDFALLLYSSGLSPRNATFLAAMSQNIKIITTKSRSYSLKYKNVFQLDNNKQLEKNIIRVILKNRDLKNQPDAEDFFTEGWMKFVKKHLEIYKALID